MDGADVVRLEHATAAIRWRETPSGWIRSKNISLLKVQDVLSAGVLIKPSNGCELSGRGSFPDLAFRQTASRISLARAAKSPVRSGE